MARITARIILDNEDLAEDFVWDYEATMGTVWSGTEGYEFEVVKQEYEAMTAAYRTLKECRESLANGERTAETDALLIRVDAAIAQLENTE